MVRMSRRSVLAGSAGLAAGGRFVASIYRQCPGEDRGLLAEPGLHSAGRRRDAAGGRGLHEGQRQQARLQHHAVHGDEPEDDLRADQRRRAGPGLHGRAVVDPAAERLGRQNGRRQRRGGAVQVAAFGNREDCARPSTTRRPRSAATTCARSSRARPRSISGATWSKRPASRCRTSRRPGTASGTIFKQTQAPLRAKGMRKIYALRPADHHGRAERRQQRVRAFPDRQRRRGHRHAGRQAAHRRSARCARRRSSRSSS